MTLIVVLAFAFGLVIPALVLASNGNDKTSEAVGGVHLNTAAAEGTRTVLAHVLALPHAAGDQVDRTHRPEPRCAGRR